MNKSDKDKLFILLVLVLYIGITVLMIVGTSKISWELMIALVLAVEYLVVQPKLCRLYYKANNSKIGFSRFIPFWNEIAIFKSTDAVIALISYILVAASISTLFIPIETINQLFGDKFALNFGHNSIRVIAIAIIIMAIATGVGFVHVGAKIRKMHIEFTKSNATLATGVIANVLLFLPIIRTITLVGYLNILEKLVLFNDYKIGTVDSSELIEEA